MPFPFMDAYYFGIVHLYTKLLLHFDASCSGGIWLWWDDDDDRFKDFATWAQKNK